MAIVWLVALAAAAGGVLHCLDRQLRQHQGRRRDLIEDINKRLPQLQCGECDYPGCRPYAEAIAAGQAGIDRCPPGGVETAAQLAALLNQPPPDIAATPARIARIREEDCVGCALCLPVCPTDAIIGTARQAHVVMANDCVGCALCLPPCPMDCIDLLPLTKQAHIPIQALPPSPPPPAAQTMP